LPIKDDKIEAKVVHEQLCSMVERSDAEILGPQNQYLPKILSIFTEVMFDLCPQFEQGCKFVAIIMYDLQ